MSPESLRLIFVVPTRNRAQLARNAIHSILDQTPNTVELWVSDNSTVTAEREALRETCQHLASPRLHYVTPPEPLSMSAHWEWALAEALAHSSATHVGFLTDRMVFRRGDLADLARVVDTHRTAVVSYEHDRVVDDVRPVVVEQAPWTGNIYRFRSRDLLRAVATLRLAHPALPKMLNCVAPRDLFERITARFGSVFSSISPDFNFCFRCLALVESVFFIDRSLLFHYAITRSNGESTARGVPNTDSVDFRASFGMAGIRLDVPVPEVFTVGNAIIHEYVAVGRETRSPLFVPVDPERYLAYLYREVKLYRDIAHREQALDLLRTKGASGAVKLFERLALTVRRLAAPNRVWDYARWTVLSRLRMSMASKRSPTPSNSDDVLALAAIARVESNGRPPRRTPYHLLEHGVPMERLPGFVARSGS